MILKVLGTILLGGGMLGAGSGWLLVRWLDARVSAAKRVVTREAKFATVVAESEAEKVRRGLVRGEFAPGATWPVSHPDEIQLWSPNWRHLRAEAHRHLRSPRDSFRPPNWPRDTWEGNDSRHP